jgi:hypothetical protein
MYDFQNYQLAQLRREAILREKTQDRLAQQALASTAATRFYAPLLVRLGHLLIVWGDDLQNQYGRVTDLSAAACDGPCQPEAASR